MGFASRMQGLLNDGKCCVQWLLMSVSPSAGHGAGGGGDDARDAISEVKGSPVHCGPKLQRYSMTQPWCSVISLVDHHQSKPGEAWPAPRAYLSCGALYTQSAFGVPEHKCRGNKHSGNGTSDKRGESLSTADYPYKSSKATAGRNMGKLASWQCNRKTKEYSQQAATAREKASDEISAVVPVLQMLLHSRATGSHLVHVEHASSIGQTSLKKHCRIFMIYL